MTEDFGAAVKRLREQRGLTKTELAYRAGVTESYVGQLERAWSTASTKPWVKNARYPTAERMESIARALSVEPQEFVQYRLARARRALSEYPADHRYVPGVGLEEAARNLAALERASALPAADVADPRAAAKVARPRGGSSRPTRRPPARKPQPRSKKRAA